MGGNRINPWSRWATSLALVSCYYGWLTGFVTVFVYPEGPEGDLSRIVGAYTLFVSIVLFPVYWPCAFCKPLIFVFQFYWLAAIIQILLSGLMFAATPTIMPGIGFFFSGCVYVVAVVQGEERKKNIRDIAVDWKRGG